MDVLKQLALIIKLYMAPCCDMSGAYSRPAQIITSTLVITSLVSQNC